jgi:two-component system, OmpR family, phosphate regulon sensor histidine kinase PhoR
MVYFCCAMAERSNNQKNRGGVRWPVIAMVLAILAITGFQGYWMKNNYEREKQNLEINTNASFRQTILWLQASKLKLDRWAFKLDSLNLDGPASRMMRDFKKRRPKPRVRKEPVITMLNILQERMKDSLRVPDSMARDRGFKKGNATIVCYSDSSKGPWKDVPKTIIRSARTGKLDTMLVDPNEVRDVRVMREKDMPDVVAIGYGNKPGDSSGQTGLELNARDIMLQRDRLPPPDEDVMVTASAYANRHPSAPVVRFLYNVDSLAQVDSVTIKEIIQAYDNRLKEDGINVPFHIDRLDSATAVNSPGAVTIGLSKPISYGLTLGSTFGYMFGKLKLPLLFSLLLIGITVAAFSLMYRNMVKQRRLAILKNEFISNITHELKTPIATVGVAIEALKDFNAIDDPQRTREYLEISQNELQRLNLLVDKVLKLSIFEQKEIELKKEVFDVRLLVSEIMNSMKLQFEKYGADVSLHPIATGPEGDNYALEADKLHITSVIYNLLDNALKYSKENPVIDVKLQSHAQHLELSVTDNGIGIADEYKGKVFDKFFRVPTGNRHNIKGYGLGLSYVSEVVKRHHGYITVDSELGKGSTFTVHIPFAEANRVQFDKHRSIKKEIA